MTRYNFRSILNILFVLLIFNGAFMLLCIPFSLYYGEGLGPFAIASGIVLLTGLIGWFTTRGKVGMELKNRDGYLVVTLGWLALSFSGSLPYVISGVIPSFTDAFFETISGYTTTGASILADIEAMPKGILFWRSLTQWMGGMGIIVLAVAILPLLGIGGMQLFGAEAPGISPDKLKPRIQDTAKRLWLIYVSLTAAECVMLMIGGLDFFDAVNHSLTTMATGGFSTRNNSVAAFDSSFVQYVIVFFMFVAGSNFTLTYFLFKGKLKKVWKNEEFRVYLFGILVITTLVTTAVLSFTGSDFKDSFRGSLFQVVSTVTTTGFATQDYTTWTPFLTMTFFGLMFLGGSTGSTAGGVKVIRHMVLFKNIILEMKRQIHRDALIPVRINGKAIGQDVTFHVLAFMAIYFVLFTLGCILLSWTGLDFKTSLGAAATCIGNIGPGLGDVGPSGNFALVSTPGKWILCFLMLVGRLELFTVLILLTPSFWKVQ